MSLPLASGKDDPSSVSIVVREVPGRGYQKRVLISDPDTGRPICQRVGGIPFATPLTATNRFKRATPLPRDFHYGSRTSPTDCTGAASECPQPRGYPAMKEDCLQMNIWIPEGQPPSEGWPVFLYIYGGFLQVGTPNAENPVNLYKYSSYRAIFVSFTYRLNAFGFLAGVELAGEDITVGNVGFWDQRLAIEFVGSEIARYGGNPKNITIGGLSAGSYSVFHQLAFSLSLPPEESHIKRAVMWSNGCGLQPKSVVEAQVSFDQLAAALGLSRKMSSKEKLSALRSCSWQDLVAAVKKVPENSFRAVSDGKFVRNSLFQELLSGTFAQKMKERGIELMIGDCCDEITAYRKISPPKSYHGLVKRLEVEFSKRMVERVMKIYCPEPQLPAGYATWQDIFGRIYSDLQVHMTERGFLSALYPVLPASRIYRYRIEMRAKMLDEVMPRSLGVTHGSDLCLWFMGNNFGLRGKLTEKEIKLARELVEPLATFIKDGKPAWGTSDIGEVRLLSDEGVKIVRDPWWERSIPIWRQIHGLDKQRL